MSYGLLKGKKGIIFGALNEQSIAWKVAERCHEEGAEFILSNAPIALRMGELNGLAEKTGSEVIGADATSIEDLEKLFDAAVAKFGKIDFILHSIGMSINVRKGKHYTEMNYDWLEKGWDISAVSFHKVMRVAYEKDCMNEWGSILAFLISQRREPSLIIMICLITKPILKALQEHSETIGVKEKYVSIQFHNLLHLQQPAAA